MQHGGEAVATVAVLPAKNLQWRPCYLSSPGLNVYFDFVHRFGKLTLKVSLQSPHIAIVCLALNKKIKTPLASTTKSPCPL